MKILFFDDFKLGVLKGDSVVDVSRVVQDIPRLGPHDVIRGVIERFAELRPRLESAAAQERGVPLDRVQIRPPLPKPASFCTSMTAIGPSRPASMRRPSNAPWPGSSACRARPWSPGRRRRPSSSSSSGRSSGRPT